MNRLVLIVLVTLISFASFPVLLCRAEAQPAQNSRTGATICVIDDSADMGDRGRDGFSVSGGNWPIMTYLLPHLGCGSCCSWTEYRLKGPTCASLCSSKVPPLTQTSPLIETLDAAASTSRGSNLIFVTNGLDWRTEGQDRSFRLEMDAGELLAKWVLSKPTREAVVGVVQDNRGKERRHNLVLGLMAAQRQDPKCELQQSNVPDSFRIRVQTFANPEGALDHGILSIYPTVQISGESRLGPVTQVFEIGADGVVHLPAGVLQRIDKPKFVITLEFDSKPRRPFCWGITAKTTTGNRLVAKCDSRMNGVAVCTFDLPSYAEWHHGVLRLNLGTSPTVPSWVSQAITEPQHAVRKTLSSFERSAEVSRRFRVKRSGAKVQDWLVISGDRERK